MMSKIARWCCAGAGVVAFAACGGDDSSSTSTTEKATTTSGAVTSSTTGLATSTSAAGSTTSATGSTTTVKSTTTLKPGTRPVLRLGDSGTAVVELQNKLRSLGAKIGADGKFGPQTEAAVKDFQTEKGLTVDGIVGPKTWKALGF